MLCFNLESLRQEYQCANYIETGKWDSRTDVSSKRALQAGFEHVFHMESRHDCYELATIEFAEEIAKGRYHLIQDLSHPCFRERSLFLIDTPVNNDVPSNHFSLLDAIQCLERDDHVILMNGLHALQIDTVKERLLIINPLYSFKTIPDDILCAYLSTSTTTAATAATTTATPTTTEKYLPTDDTGNVHRVSTNWFSAIPLPSGPLQIIEIGSAHGGNVCNLTKTYGAHPDSTIHVIDPWSNKINRDYHYFIQNIAKLDTEHLHKIHLHRGLSEHILPLFDDDSFDIIYINGNHTRQYVLHDAMMAFKKVKHDGYLIFNEMNSEDVYHAVQLFAHVYQSSLSEIHNVNGQLILKIKKEA